MITTIQLPGGDEFEVTLYDLVRFWSKVDPRGPRTCWLWKGSCDRDGYGNFTLRGRHIAAHRLAYLISVGPIPQGLEIDHVWTRGCTSRSCTNPAHLEPVTRAENDRRRKEAKTYCANGHEYTPENTYQRPSGVRECRTCRRENARAWRPQRAASARGVGQGGAAPQLSSPWPPP